MQKIKKIGLACLGSVVLAACQQSADGLLTLPSVNDSSTNTPAMPIQNALDKGMQSLDLPLYPHVNSGDSGVLSDVEQAKKLDENLKKSYARQAAKRTDICPKMLEFEVDNHVTTRQNEHMQTNKCEYIVYVQKNQRLDVVLDNTNMYAKLVSPYIHEFNNGSYVAKKGGKHIIVVGYRGFHGMRAAENYDIAVRLD